MGVRRNAVLGLITLAAFIGCGLMANAQESQVDYDGFLGLSAEIADYRESRLVDLDTFNRMKAEPGTIVTRPFQLEGTRLNVNVDAGHGSLAVEVLDASGEPINGFSRQPL